MRVEQVERVKAPSRPQFESQYLAGSGRPVVITGMLEDWKALAEWSPDYLRRTIGGESFVYRACSGNVHPTDPSTSELSHEAYGPFSEYLDALLGEDGARYFLSGEQVLFQGPQGGNPSLAPLAADFSMPPYLDAQALRSVGLWVSARGVVSWLHYDVLPNLNVQVTGRKRALLIPPEQAAYVYPYACSHLGAHNFSQVDVTRPDAARFPDYARATFYEAILEPGDMLFIPSFWWHSFTHLEAFNTNVNFWWARPGLELNATSAQWAFGDALLRTLAKGRKLPVAFLQAKLTPEQQRFCVELEHQLMQAAQDGAH